MLRDALERNMDDEYHFKHKTFPSATHKLKDKKHKDIGKITAVHPAMWDWLHHHNFWGS